MRFFSSPVVRQRLARYSLLGPEGQLAVEAGLTEGDWFRSEIPRRRMKELMRRSDSPALRDLGIWLGAMVVLGAAGGLLWGHSWVAVPLLLGYGVLYGSAAAPRWHECLHGTPFRTRAVNDAVFWLASFMIMKDPTVTRWSHTRHHTDTLILGRDPEIAVMRPARLARILVNFVGLADVPTALAAMVRHASGRLGAEEATYVPDSERRRVVLTARVWLAIYAAVVATSVLTGSVLPVLLIGGPRIYGCWMSTAFGLLEHAGMGENVLDHRLNARTVHMCRLNRFLVWNMNYHVEHHMFPMVPYHRLPELHAEIKHDLAPAYPSVWAAYREIVPAVLRQLRDPTYYIERHLPPTAAPYHPRSDGRALAHAGRSEA